MELTIKDKTYPLKASFKFLRKIEKTAVRDISGLSLDWGLASVVSQLRDAGDMRMLVELLTALNEGQTPHLEKSAVEAYLEDECEDPEALAEEVIDFLSQANVCRSRLKKLGILETRKSPEKNTRA